MPCICRSAHVFKPFKGAFHVSTFITADLIEPFSLLCDRIESRWCLLPLSTAVSVAHTATALNHSAVHLQPHIVTRHIHLNATFLSANTPMVKHSLFCLPIKYIALRDTTPLQTTPCCRLGTRCPSVRSLPPSCKCCCGCSPLCHSPWPSSWMQPWATPGRTLCLRGRSLGRSSRCTQKQVMTGPRTRMLSSWRMDRSHPEASNPHITLNFSPFHPPPP